MRGETAGREIDYAGSSYERKQIKESGMASAKLPEHYRNTPGVFALKGGEGSGGVGNCRQQIFRRGSIKSTQ